MCAWLYPIGAYGHNGTLDVAEVKCDCPGLMSDNTLHKLAISLHTGPRTLDVGLFGIKDKPMIRDPTSGHSLIEIINYGDDQIDECFQMGHPSLRGPEKVDPETGEGTSCLSKGTMKRLKKNCSVVADVMKQVSLDEPANTEQEYTPSEGAASTPSSGHIRAERRNNQGTAGDLPPPNILSGHLHNWARVD